MKSELPRTPGTRSLLAPVLTILGTCMWGLWLRWHGPGGLDVAALSWFRTSGDSAQLAGPEWLTPSWMTLSRMGDAAPRIVAASSMITVLLLLRRWRCALLSSWILLGGLGLTAAIKAALGRPRPQLVSHLVPASSGSFPSGHALDGTLFYLLAAFVLAGFVRRRGARWTLFAAAVSLSLLTGISRVALGVHYPTDVIAGWLIGAAWVWLWFVLAGRYWPDALPGHEPSPTRLPRARAGATAILKNLDDPAFSEAECDALFAAVMVHDEIDLEADLPESIHLNYDEEQLICCYRICRQVWREGVDREALAGLIRKIQRRRTLGPEDQLAFMRVRARFKHLRFAYVTFDARHRYPAAFHRMIILMGRLQDAIKHEGRAAISLSACLLRLSLYRLPFTLFTAAIDRFRPTTPEAFREYVNAELTFLRLKLAEERVTARDFHQMRKVISRQVALYDNLKTLFPSPYHRSLSRFLSTINGLMGGLHDELVAAQFARGKGTDAETLEIPDGIRRRLVALTESYVQLR